MPAYHACFSVSYAGFWGQAALPLAEFIARAGRLGFASVMIAGKRPHLSPLDAQPGDAGGSAGAHWQRQA